MCNVIYKTLRNQFRIKLFVKFFVKSFVKLRNLESSLQSMIKKFFNNLFTTKEKKSRFRDHNYYFISYHVDNIVVQFS